jgi:hypothetical protein
MMRETSESFHALTPERPSLPPPVDTMHRPAGARRVNRNNLDPATMHSLGIDRNDDIQGQLPGIGTAYVVCFFIYMYIL